MHIPKPNSMDTLKRKLMQIETFLKQRRCATEFAELFKMALLMLEVATHSAHIQVKVLRIIQDVTT